VPVSKQQHSSLSKVAECGTCCARSVCPCCISHSPALQVVECRSCEVNTPHPKEVCSVLFRQTNKHTHAHAHTHTHTHTHARTHTHTHLHTHHKLIIFPLIHLQSKALRAEQWVASSLHPTFHTPQTCHSCLVHPLLFRHTLFRYFDMHNSVMHTYACIHPCAGLPLGP
jgi:hypothetical protein